MSYPRLNGQQINQMLKLQQLFHNRYLNPQFLHQLIAIYVKAIEEFNSQYKFMRTYFMDKMQFVLASPEIVAMLEGGGNISESIRETIRITQRPRFQQPSVKVEDFERSHRNVEKQKQKQKKKQSQDRFKKKDIEIKHTHEQHHYYHYDEQKNNQKGLKIDMKMKLMRQVEENMKNIQKEVNQADRKLIIAEEKVKDITKTQDQLLNERLAKRKRKIRKKSVQIKAQVEKPDSEQTQPEPVIKKEELKEAQRQLTRAIFMYTIRMTQKQREKQNLHANKNVKGRVKKAKDLDEDDMLLEQQEQHQSQKEEADMRKNKPVQQPQAQSHGRIKTTRRHLDSDDDQ